MENKKLIIHMVNGDQYQLNSNKDFDRKNELTVKEINAYLTREIKDNEKTFTFNDKGTDIKYVSRFAIYNVDRATIALDSISSFELVEEI
jgi:hypothetical protein